MKAKEHVVGIPTRYRGRQYRSRLEARWACFFDLVGWRYEYEPCDFEGWIPDFVLLGADSVFVEVKPVNTFPQEVADKIDATSCATEVLILGYSLLPAYYWWNPETRQPDGWCRGWLRETDIDAEEELIKTWNDAPLGQWEGAKTIGFCHVEQSFRDRISGKYDGGCYGGVILDMTKVYNLWQQAGNHTQWRKETL